MAANVLVLSSLAFLPHIFQSNANPCHAIPNNFLSTLVTASLQLSFGFPTCRLLHIVHSKILRSELHQTILQMCPTHYCILTSARVTTCSVCTDNYRFRHYSGYCTVRFPALARILFYIFSVQKLQGPAISLDTIQLPRG
jgi:hypothetical protein